MMKPLRLLPRAFSLIELLVVIAIIALLATLTAPAISSLLTSINLNRAGQQFVDEILVARQIAVTRNRDVQVRFIEITNGMQSGYRGLQIWMADDSGTNQTPARRLILLPESIIVNSNADYSPLLFRGNTFSGSTNFSSYGTRPYVGFRFRANGQTDLTPAIGTNVIDGMNFLTLQSTRTQGNSPDNFYSILVNDFTGRVSVSQP